MRKDQSSISIICLVASAGALVLSIIYFAPRAVMPPDLAVIVTPAPGRGDSAVSAQEQPITKASASYRGPASLSGFRDSFLRASSGEWNIETGRQGFISRISGAAYPAKALGPGDPADNFLRTFAAGLLGTGFETLVPAGRRISGGLAQVLYEQKVNGLEVLGTRVNLMVDGEGSIVYAASTVSHGPFPSPAPNFNQIEAASAVRESMRGYLARAGGSIDAAEYSLEAISQAVTLAYRLSGDSTGLIYKVEFTLAEPHYGTMQALVDAQTNTVVQLKAQARN